MSPSRVRTPQTLASFSAKYPRAWTRYRALREACDRSGPLTPRTRELIKIGIEVAVRRHGGLVAHLHRAQAAGASSAEIYHAIVLAMPLVGLPNVLDAFVTAQNTLG